MYFCPLLFFWGLDLTFVNLLIPQAGQPAFTRKREKENSVNINDVMVYSILTESLFNTICIYPQSGETLAEQLANCYEQFTENHISKVYSKSSIVKQTILISSLSNPDFYQSRSELLKSAGDFFEIIPTTSVISQTPEKGSLLLELTIIKDLKTAEISFRKNDESSWFIIEKEGIKILIASGFGQDSGENNILDQSDTAFRKLNTILGEEDFEFSDIIRQWNYIEQITDTVIHKDEKSQNYQVFNDVRSRYYSQSVFKNGFPAATGIGTEFGGVTIDIIAAKFDDRYSVVPVKSPVQLDAYSYSKKVLAENHSMNDFSRTTPKFERAKILETPGSDVIFISGTAAIKGQMSSNEISVEQQTEMTIQNILSLISAGNLLRNGLRTSQKAEMLNLRVYVKHKKDMNQVKEICQKHFPETPCIYVAADICRPELLVEIEGQAVVK